MTAGTELVAAMAAAAAIIEKVRIESSLECFANEQTFGLNSCHGHGEPCLAVGLTTTKHGP
jgi:hypothetical protein